MSDSKFRPLGKWMERFDGGRYTAASRGVVSDTDRVARNRQFQAPVESLRDKGPVLVKNGSFLPHLGGAPGSAFQARGGLDIEPLGDGV